MNACSSSAQWLIGEAPERLLDALAKLKQANAGPREDAPNGRHQNREFEQLLVQVRTASEGQRNQTLNNVAHRAGQLIRAGRLERDAAEHALRAAALECGLGDEEIERTLASGINAGTAQPRQRDMDGERPVIQLQAGRLAVTASQVEQALIAARVPFFVRGGLVRPVVDTLPAAHGSGTKSPRLVTVDDDTIIDHTSRHIDLQRFDLRRNEWVPTDPPRQLAQTIRARDGEWPFRILTAVTTCPTFRPDGTIHLKPGYDPATGMLLLEPPAIPPIAECPTRTDAEAGLRLLDVLLSGFPFADAASRSVALSALLTPVVRGIAPVVPLHAISAPVAGSGKSYLIDLASAIATGERAPVIAAGHNEEETEKRLGAALLSGLPIVSIDNVNGHLGGDALCQLIERPRVSLRPLGSSKLVTIESRATTYATGNNIQLTADMTRRGILCSLDPNLERPELRVFDLNPLETILADRGKYIAAALTIVRAYIVAGCPGALPPLGSFEAWSTYVRSALVWLGCADPLATMEAARAEDPVTTSLRMVMHSWHDAVGDQAKKAGEMKKLAEEYFGSGKSDLEQALIEVAADRIGAIDPVRLGRFLLRHKGRIVDGLRLQGHDDGHSKQKVWSVRHV